MIENRLTKEEYERILALDSYLTVVYRMKMVIRVCAIASRKRLMEDLQQYGSMIQQIIMKEMMYCMTPIAVKEAIHQHLMTCLQQGEELIGQLSLPHRRLK